MFEALGPNGTVDLVGDAARYVLDDHVVVLVNQGREGGSDNPEVVNMLARPLGITVTIDYSSHAVDYKAIFKPGGANLGSAIIKKIIDNW